MAIISLSGRLRSGKDTVAKMIQYLTSECSNKEGGKYRTFKEFIENNGGSNSRDFDFHYQSEWEIHKFAHKLKQIAGILLGDSNFEYQWENGDDVYRNTILPDWRITRREFLQRLGTDAVRNGLHTDAWVIATLAEYKPYIIDREEKVASDGGYYSSPGYKEYPQWIISDTRFPNEIEAIRSKGGIAVRVNRSAKNRSTDTLRKKDEHPSETSLDQYNFDEEINNDGTLDELQERVYYFLLKYHLIESMIRRDNYISKFNGKYIIGVDPVNANI